MMPNFLPSSLREDPFKGELTDERFQSIFAQNICYGVLDENAIIAITDAKGVIKYANHSFVKLSKYSLAELVGATHRILNSGFHPRSSFMDMYRDIGQREKVASQAADWPHAPAENLGTSQRILGRCFNDNGAGA